jgi:hypothetical protein
MGVGAAAVLFTRRLRVMTQRVIEPVHVPVLLAMLFEVGAKFVFVGGAICGHLL